MSKTTTQPESPDGTDGSTAVPHVYKRTEAWVIPQDWQVGSLRDALQRGVLGGNYPNQDTETSFPLIKMGNVGRGGFDTSMVEYIPEHFAPDPSHLLKRGDVLFNTRNTLDLVGKVAIWRDELPIAYYNSNLMRLEFNPEVVISSAYANYALNSDMSISLLRGLATGTTSVAAIYTRDLLKLPFVVPSKPEQRAIAAALSDVDGLIGAFDKLTAKKRAIKKAAMQQLLTGKTRLPGFGEEWRVCQLSELGQFSKGRGIKREDVSGEGVGCIRYGEIYTRYDNYVMAPVSRISQSVAASALPIKKGDLLFAGSGETAEEIGKCVAYLGEHEAYAGGDIVVHTPSGQDSLYLGHLLNHESVAQQKARLAQGDAVVHISAGSLGQLRLRLPSLLDEQRAISTVLADMDAEIAVLKQRRDKTQQIKQGMMQTLLTGRIRLV